MKRNSHKSFMSRPLVRGLICVVLTGFLMTGCGKGNEEQAVSPSVTDLATPKPTSTPTPKKTYAPAPTPTPEAKLEVTQAVAYYFPDIEGFPSLYAAVEFENTGTAPIVAENVQLRFNTGEFRVDGDFTPMQMPNDVVAPGQTSTLAFWMVYDKETKTLKADSPIKVTAEITPRLYDTTLPDRRLYVSNLRLIQNYPKFPTVSGSILNPSQDQDYALSLIYVSFYDDNDTLLGVWHFTRAIAVPAENSRNFVMHLQTLPIPDLSQKATKIVARGVGID